MRTWRSAPAQALRTLMCLVSEAICWTCLAGCLIGASTCSAHSRWFQAFQSSLLRPSSPRVEDARPWQARPASRHWQEGWPAARVSLRESNGLPVPRRERRDRGLGCHPQRAAHGAHCNHREPHGGLEAGAWAAATCAGAGGALYLLPGRALFVARGHGRLAARSFRWL